MIIFAQADGTVQSILPSPVYQGSALEGSLYFVAPFPETNAVEVAFVRANGDVIGKYGLTRVTSGLPDVLDKLGTEYNVWEWQASNADVTAYAGEVVMQFRVIYAGQTLATASTVFMVQEGVIPQPVEPSADQWDTLIELYSRLNAKVPDVFLTDIAISEPDEDNIVTVTKYYNNGTTATEEFPAGGTSFSVKSEWVKVIDFTTSAWVNASSGSGYEIAFPPSQTGYTDNKFLTSLESTETGGYSTLADTVFKGSDGSVLISATEKYGGRLVTLGGGIWGGVNVTAGSGEDSVQQVGGAKANGKQSAAFGGLRYDKQTGRTPTSADGNQSFAAGGSVHAEGDFSAVFGKDTVARQRASFAAGSSTAGMTEEEFNAFFWDSTNNVGLHGGSKNSDGKICDFTGATYEKSFAFATALGCDCEAKGPRSFSAGDNTVAANVGAAAVGMNTNASGTAAFAEGYKTQASGEHSHAGGGQFTRAVGFDSFAHGANAEARADRSAAFGFETISASDNGMAIGKQNVVRTDALFQVGNGTNYNQRRDAFVVLKDGRAKLQAGPIDDDDIVRKEDLGYEIDFPHGEPTVRCDNTDGITVTGTMRIYLNQTKTVFRDVPNVSVEIPIFAGKNVTIDADETNKKAVVKASDIDVNTLIPLLLGSNGIKLTKNEAGDRLLIGISRLGFELGTFEATGDGIKFAYNDSIAEQIYLGASLGGAIDIYNSLVSIDNYIRVKATADEYIEINNEDVLYHTASGVKHYLREGNVKTIGGQSIYGTGDISVGGGTIDADTLNGLLSGGNGITIDKAATGETVEVKVAAPLNLTSTADGFAIFVTVNDNSEASFAGGLLVINDNNRVMIGGGAIAVIDNSNSKGIFITDTDVVYTDNTAGSQYNFLRQNNVKTLFGNKSIYGSGNIDLYRHFIQIKINKAGTQVAWISTIHISSSNTPIDSLSDFFTVFNSIGYAYPCMGFARDADGLYQSVINVEARSNGGVSFANTAPTFSWSDTSLNITVEDTVTTV